MKKINILFGLLVGTLTFTSCSDSFLEQDDPIKQSANEYYKDSTHVVQSIIAAYSPTEWNDWNGYQYSPQNVMSEIMGDDFFVGGSGPGDNKFWHLMANYESTPTECLTGIWTNMFTGVKRCNDAVKYIEEFKENVTEKTYKSWNAEARVLRAYYYIWLWKFYGNIPYFTVNTTSGYSYPQLPAAEIYENVIADLEEVIALNVLPMEWDEDNLGRVSQAMAYMLYADYVMYQNDASRYSKALGYMKDIINDSHYGLHSDYKELFESAGEWCEETIFEVNYSDDKTFRGWGHDDAIYAGGTVVPRLCSAPMAIAAIGANDGWGFAPVRPSTYEMFARNDVRRDVSILDVRPYTEGNPDFQPRYQNTGFWMGKNYAYAVNCERSTGDQQLNYNYNLRVYRYAETLLNAAELLVRTNGDLALAKSYITKVRQRAGLVSEVEPTLDNIIQERHLEFVSEGKRYWDLVRTDKASTVLVAEPDVPNSERTNSWNKEKNMYLPIPYTEMAADPNLVQNPGY